MDVKIELTVARNMEGSLQWGDGVVSRWRARTEAWLLWQLQLSNVTVPRWRLDGFTCKLHTQGGGV